ncbi:reverse transcriptase N-terminal domain-containing protein, partial [Salmonella enterica]
MNTETRVESQAVSASSRPERWHAINWRKTSEAVRKLQVRIAKAALQQEWRRVKAL